MLGNRHKLLVRKESTYADTRGDDVGGFKGYHVYSNMGSRPSKTVSQISGNTLGRVAKAPTVGRQSVAGAFSMFLPANNFGVFYENLLGYSINNQEGKIDSTDDNETHFKTVSTVSPESLGLISFFDNNNIFVYDGMCINSANISCGDPNSLVETTLNFLGSDLRKGVHSNAADSTKIDILHYSGETSVTNIDEVDIDLAISQPDFFPAYNTRIHPGTISEGAYQTPVMFGAGLFSEFRGLTIDINNNLAFDGRISGASGNNVSNLAAGLIGNQRDSGGRPRPAGERVVSGSFEIPYPYGAQDRVDFGNFTKMVQETKGDALTIGFTSAAGIPTSMVMHFPKVYYDLPDFTTITHGITTIPINFKATTKCMEETTNSHDYSELEIYTLEASTGLY